MTNAPAQKGVVVVMLNHDPDTMTIHRHYRDGSCVKTYDGPVSTAEASRELLVSAKALVHIYDEHLNLSRCHKQIAAARAAIEKAEGL